MRHVLLAIAIGFFLVRYVWAQNVLPPLSSKAWQSSATCNPVQRNAADELTWNGCASAVQCKDGLRGPTCSFQVPASGWYQLRTRFLDELTVSPGKSSAVAELRGVVEYRLHARWDGGNPPWAPVHMGTVGLVLLAARPLPSPVSVPGVMGVLGLDPFASWGWIALPAMSAPVLHRMDFVHARPFDKLSVQVLELAPGPVLRLGDTVTLGP